MPYLGKAKDDFQAIADKYYVQIRGANGEHTETDDHIYDISNKRRLGRSEVDLVQDMYNGVKAMIEKEKELAPKPAVEPKTEAPKEEKKEAPKEEKKEAPKEEKMEEKKEEKTEEAAAVAAETSKP